MKKYKEFMDGVKAPDTLRQRLTELETPEKRSIPWKRYGAMAAALALVCGLGGLGAWAMRANSLDGPIPPYPSNYQGTQPENIDVPDIAQADPGDLTEPGQRTLGGYDVTEGTMSVHYVLPYIEYGEAGNPSRYALDWDIPQGAHKRDLSQEEIAALMGGEDALSTHLDWGGYTLTGWGAWYEDGSFWGAYINGEELLVPGPANSFEFAVTAGQLPPTCIAFPEQVEQDIGGVTVTANSYETAAGSSQLEKPVSIRQVSFMKDGNGYRFDMRSGNSELAEKMVSRLVRQVAQEGLALSAIPAYEGGVMPSEALDPSDNPVAPHICPECGEEIMPGVSHHHSHETDPACVCEVCGQEVPAGTDHSHTCATCGQTVYAGDNHSHTCEVCGQTVHAGENHSHTCGVCGQTVHAGDNHIHTCGMCGVTYPAGTAHTCPQGGHHQGGHHGNHH